MYKLYGAIVWKYELYKISIKNKVYTSNMLPVPILVSEVTVYISNLLLIILCEMNLPIFYLYLIMLS